MWITRLRVAQLRVFEEEEFVFRPGMNLLVGLNGVGKSTVLDSIRILLSQTLPRFTPSRGRSLGFHIDDIRCGRPSLTAEIGFQIGQIEVTYSVHKGREHFLPSQGGDVREQGTETPDLVDWRPSAPEVARQVMVSREQPFGVFFSTRRSLPTEGSPSKQSAAGGQVAAYADALEHRELRLRDFAHWWRVQEAIARESSRSKTGKHLTTLNRAATSFLPGYRDLRLDSERRVPRLVMNKNKDCLHLRQLSDGERGIVAVVLDLSKRLSQANPDLEDPARNGSAVVLIDELDLHLHPKWQRTIVARLTRTFPKCQFIATTHSPQIIAEVEPEQVQVLTRQGVVRPDRTRGLDSNWILRHVMETDERPAGAAKAISQVESLIKKGHFKKARANIAARRHEGLELPEWSVLEARMARMEVLAR